MLPRRFAAAAVLSIVALGQWPAAASAQATAGLPRWFAGCWSGTRGAERFTERWIVADAATMIGTSHTVKGDALAAFEFLRVVTRDDRLIYIAQPGGRTPTEFAASAPAAAAIVFENPDHDFPKRIGYQLVDATHLTAWIDGGAAGGRRIEYPMARVPCEP